MAAATETKARPQQKPLPAPNSDFCQLAETLKADELVVVKQVGAAVVIVCENGVAAFDATLLVAVRLIAKVPVC